MLLIRSRLVYLQIAQLLLLDVAIGVQVLGILFPQVQVGEADRDRGAQQDSQLPLGEYRAGAASGHAAQLFI